MKRYKVELGKVSLADLATPGPSTETVIEFEVEAETQEEAMELAEHYEGRPISEMPEGARTYERARDPIPPGGA